MITFVGLVDWETKIAKDKTEIFFFLNQIKFTDQSKFVFTL